MPQWYHSRTMVTVLTGNNEFMLKSELNKLTADFMAEHGDLAVERLDGEEVEVDAVVDAVQSLPFLTSKKLVVLKSAGSNKPLTESVGKIIDATADSTELIIYEPSPDKRTQYYKALKKEKAFKEFGELDARNLTNWLIGFAKESGGTISYANSIYLVERAGADQLKLSNEVQKLIAYNPNITKENIELLTEQTLNSKIFDLIDSAFSGRAEKAIQIYDEQRILKVEPQQIIGMLTWQLTAIAQVKYGTDKPNQQIAKDSGLNPFVVQKSRALSDKINVTKLKKLISDLLKIDIESKTTPLDVDDALKHYILTMQ